MWTRFSAIMDIVAPESRAALALWVCVPLMTSSRAVCRSSWGGSDTDVGMLSDDRASIAFPEPTVVFALAAAGGWVWAGVWAGWVWTGVWAVWVWTGVWAGWVKDSWLESLCKIVLCLLEHLLQLYAEVHWWLDARQLEQYRWSLTTWPCLTSS